MQTILASLLGQTGQTRGFSLMWVTLAVVVILVLVVGLTGLPGDDERKDVAENADPDNAVVNDPGEENEGSDVTDPITGPRVKIFRSAEVEGVDDVYRFSSEIPPSWQAEAVSETEALALYDPDAEGATNLEKARVFIRHFSANTFLTLSTVTIHSREELTVAGRPAVRYDIEKKSGAADFPNQPSWRNRRHIVTDVRVSDSNPSVFYVIAKHPDMDMEEYEHFLNSLVLDTDAASAGLIEPVEQFRERITLKRFGQFITSQNSPVQPERFSGYHAAVDVEFTGTDAIPIPVRALASGEIILSRTASGYGGVFVLRFSWEGETYTAVYGHIAPDSLPSVGTQVSAGEELGYLGEGGTSQTDGERKHLHFGIHPGSGADIAGYVQSEQALSGWRDPLEFFSD